MMGEEKYLGGWGVLAVTQSSIREALKFEQNSQASSGSMKKARKNLENTFEKNESENTTYENLGYAVKAVLVGKFLPVNTSIGRS